MLTLSIAHSIPIPSHTLGNYHDDVKTLARISPVDSTEFRCFQISNDP